MSGPENRRTNIRLAAAAVDGTILMPGETFSYNKIVGERTAAKGYKPATVYGAAWTKQELGGGICQLASALYYCTLYSNLEVVYRTNHRFAVTYVPHGLDATVAWGSIDYKFKNSTDYPIRISALHRGHQPLSWCFTAPRRTTAMWRWKPGGCPPLPTPLSTKSTVPACRGNQNSDQRLYRL